jgi:hypothetical protein
MGMANLRRKMLLQGLVAVGSQARGAVADIRARNLRHARRGRALARAERKDMQERKAAIVNQAQRIIKHLFGFRWKACDDVGAKHHIWTQSACILTKPNGIVAQMTPLHPLQHHVIARLQ